MKLIHTADLHLDSKLSAHLTEAKAKERRDELLQTYLRMIDFALEEGVQAILIAGDLFDTRRISPVAKDTVLKSMRQHPELLFFYVTGNHERDGFLSSLSEIPENLNLFGDHWKRYEAGSVVIFGADLESANRQELFAGLSPDPNKINLVLLHGQVAEYASDHKAEIIDLSAFRNRSIDYLALGHLHAYRKETLAPRGVWCYPGALEGRGFDEVGEHGFVLLDIDTDTHSVQSRFIPFAKRQVREIPVDVSGCLSTMDALSVIEAKLGEEPDQAKPSDYWKIVLIGEVDVDCVIDRELIRQRLSDRCYALKIEDKTRLMVVYQQYENDRSLKGEFVRIVRADDALSEQDKAEIIQCGIRALAGEEAE